MITSLKNRRIVEARKLSQRKQRQRQGRFLVEGLQILHMALDAGTRAVEVFFCESQFAGTEAAQLIPRFDLAGADLISVSEGVMHALSQRESPQGIVATFALFETAPQALELTGYELVVVLDRLQNPGNAGALIRVADAVGASAIVLIEPCVDIFDPQAVRSSMGSVFNIPLVRMRDVPSGFAWLRSQRLRLVGADPHQEEPWGQGLWDAGVALVLGNEARGLSQDVLHHIDHFAALPVVGKAESLNVAVAGGVLMYLWLRDNQETAARGDIEGAKAIEE